MEEEKLYNKMANLNEKINNNDNKEDVLRELNDIQIELLELSINKKFRELLILYQTHYEDYLFANNIREEKK